MTQTVSSAVLGVPAPRMIPAARTSVASQLHTADQMVIAQEYLRPLLSQAQHQRSLHLRQLRRYPLPR
jgi:hypothetical protein